MRVLVFVLCVVPSVSRGQDLPLLRIGGNTGIFSSTLFVTDDPVATGSYTGGTEGASVNGIGLADVLIVPAFSATSLAPYCSASAMQMPGSAGFGDLALAATGTQNVQVQAGTGGEPGGWAEGSLSMSINDPDGNGATFASAVFGTVQIETQTLAGVPALWVNGAPAGIVTPDALIVTREYYPIGTDFPISAWGRVASAIPAPSSFSSVSFGKVVAAPFPEVDGNGRWTNVVRVFVPEEEEPVAVIPFSSTMIHPNWPF